MSASVPFHTAFLLTDRALADPAFKSVGRFYRRWTRAIESILREGIDAGEFREVEQHLAQRAILSLRVASATNQAR